MYEKKKEESVPLDERRAAEETFKLLEQMPPEVLIAVQALIAGIKINAELNRGSEKSA